MTITVAEIAKQAFNGVAAALGGVVSDATLSYDAQGAHDPVTGTAITTTTSATGRAVIGTSAAIPSKFPSYVVGPFDTLIMLEGFSMAPKVGFKVTIGTNERTIKAVGDIAGAGEFFEVVAV